MVIFMQNRLWQSIYHHTGNCCTFEQGDILMKYGKSALTEATETRDFDNRVWSATAAATYKTVLKVIFICGRLF